jgi:hypothetical protein
MWQSPINLVINSNLVYNHSYMWQYWCIPFTVKGQNFCQENQSWFWNTLLNHHILLQVTLSPSLTSIINSGDYILKLWKRIRRLWLPFWTTYRRLISRSVSTVENNVAIHKQLQKGTILTGTTQFRVEFHTGLPVSTVSLFNCQMSYATEPLQIKGKEAILSNMECWNGLTTWQRWGFYWILRNRNEG